ncbi:ABC transporter permease [Spirosoma endophyticum]|uniref:Duplicated orphan permease n=1 Tax=Spirosoma endophyticum TaxID=662367 RepID=A0A1I2F4E3_9BACT|nr:ABC transporter permease [Spirosoma endophyticum]SFE99869.1 duplicated orphan permease [Spirosoma endophyticum]
MKTNPHRNQSGESPPQWADRLLGWFCTPHKLEEILGDLHEEFAYQVDRVGVQRARQLYVQEVLGFIHIFPSKQTTDSVFFTFLLHPDMLANYLKIALRTLWKNKVYSGINVAGLAIGLAACLAIGLYILDEFTYDRFNTHYDSIYRIVENQKQASGIYNVAVTPGPLAATLTKDFPDVLQTTRVGRWSGALTQGRKAVEADNMFFVDPAFFSLFTYPLVLGNVNNVFLSPDEVIISESMAERFFGTNWASTAILGKPFKLNSDHTLTLAGVVKNPPEHSHLQFDVLLPFKYLEQYDEWSMKWNSNSYHTYIRLRPETNLVSFTDKIQLQIKRYANESGTTLELQPLRDIYLKSTFDFQTDWGKRSNMLYVRIFLTVGLIVLLIAVVNFINLATARASQRAREVGVRKTIGAQRSSLVVQFLGESFLLTSLAVAGALLLMQSLLPLFNSLSDKSLTLPYQDVRFWFFLLGLTVFVSLLTGLYPAFFLSSFRPARVLKGVFTIKTGQTFRQSLVVGQFALSIVLAIATVVIYQQLNFIQTKKLGFDKSQLLYVRLKGDLRAKALAIKQDIQRLPGVANVSTTTSNLVDVMNSGTIEWQGQTPKDEFLITNMNVDADFMKTTGMSLAAGRNFSAQITSDTSSKLGSYLINESAAKRMGWTPASALGKTIKFWGMDGKVVGVLRDFHFRPLRVVIEPFIFRFRPKDYYFNLLIKTQPNAVQRTLSDIGSVYKTYDATFPISYGFVDQDLNTQYRTEQRTGQIVLYFSILAILVSCLGLFGLTTFTTEQRIKEIGMRKVLGASVSSIVTLLSKDFVKLVLIAILIASPVAWWASKIWLQDFVYKIDVEWWVFALVGGLSISIALLTVGFQSVKAALMNPVKSLRSE